MDPATAALILMMGDGGGSYYSYSAPRHGYVIDSRGAGVTYTRLGRLGTFYQQIPPGAYFGPTTWAPPAYGANPFTYGNSTGLIYNRGLGYPVR